MEQARFEELLKEFQTRCSQENAIVELEAVAGEVGAPVVVLVHGIGGNARHWSDPISLDINSTWLFDLNAMPTTNARGVTTSPPYQPGAANSWCQALNAHNLTYINFTQARSGDLLQYAVAEMVAMLGKLEEIIYRPFEEDAATGATIPPLVILCHSRGGLVTRAALKQLGSAGVPHLRQVITLCTPHHGSYMPRLANDYNNSLHNQVKIDIGFFQYLLVPPLNIFLKDVINEHLSQLANLIRQSMLHSFGTMASSPGFDELIPESNMLKALVQDEQPLAGVEYHGFGGSNPTFVEFFLIVAGKVIKLMGTASGALLGLLSNIPGVRQNYGGIAEMELGDSAVSLVSSRWPAQFKASHADYHLNHMQALIDPALQDAVLNKITAQPVETSGSASF